MVPPNTLEVIQHTTPLEYGWMSRAVYENLNMPEGSSNPTHQNLLKKKWRLSHFISGKDNAGGYQGAVYIHDDRQEIVVSHCGTKNIGSIAADILADLEPTTTSTVQSSNAHTT